MAKTNVPQGCGVCQEVSKKNFGKLFESYRDGFAIQKLLAIEVFDGGNDRAADILALCGFDKLIGGTNFASIGDVAEFYGVTLKYVKDSMGRYGVGAKDLPEDVYTDRYYDFITRFGKEAEKRFIRKRCNESGTFVIYDSLTKRKLAIKGDDQRKTTYISARLALMLSCFLFCGRNIPADSMVKTVYEKLQSTRFFENAQKRKWENDQRHLMLLEEKRQSRIGQVNESIADFPYDSDNILATRANGDVIMSGEVFDKLLERSMTGTQEILSDLPNVIQKAIKEALSERAANEKSTPKKKSTQKGCKRFPTKLKKPDDWDEIVDLWNQGKITGKEAARRSGMSLSSFRNYTVKGKKFA